MYAPDHISRPLPIKEYSRPVHKYADPAWPCLATRRHPPRPPVRIPGEDLQKRPRRPSDNRQPVEISSVANFQPGATESKFSSPTKGEESTTVGLSLPRSGMGHDFDGGSSGLRARGARARNTNFVAARSHLRGSGLD
ncbi:hypothetical protein VUR80DRAFT_3555 [Thermomyces stellatus]